MILALQGEHKNISIYISMFYTQNILGEKNVIYTIF